MIKRLFDIIFSIVAIFLCLIPCFFIAVIVALDSRGPIIHLSERVGVKKNFKMPKFRTMYKDAPIIATHLISNSEKLVTRPGRILRKLSLDELPQLVSVLLGHMSLVGPRPALWNQIDLIELRKKYGIDQLKPGITGLAQINGRDKLTINEKVDFEKEYLKDISFTLDIKILLLTIFVVLKKEHIKH